MTTSIGILSRAVRTCAVFAGLGVLATAQAGTVRAEQKISETTGGFGGLLDANDDFGFSVAALGDLDGDGNGDLAVGAYLDDDVETDMGAVWILFMNADGTVASQQKISGYGFNPSDYFGVSVAALGDLDGNGTGELAIGSRDDFFGLLQGAVHVLSLNSDGTIAGEQLITESSPGFGGVLEPGDFFGASVAALGDLDGDGTGDLAVGAPVSDDGEPDQGAVWILFLNPDGTVSSEQKISETAGGFGGVLDYWDWFGFSAAALGDLDGNGIRDLAVGAWLDDDGGTDQGAVWILLLNSDGTVSSEQKISETAGGFGGVLDPGDGFGFSLAALGDLDGDGRVELAVGANGDDDGGTDQGTLWILSLDPDGTVFSERKINETSGGFGGVLAPGDSFGTSVAPLGDVDGDGAIDLAVGAPLTDDGGTNQGALWILFLEGGAPPPLAPRRGSPLPFVSLPSVVVPSTSDAGGPWKGPAPFAPGQVAALELGGASLRNGSGVNEVSLSSAWTPRAGETWQAWVDASAHPRVSASLVLVSERALAGRVTPCGELLVDVVARPPLATSFLASSGATDVHVLPVPAELVGRSFSLQALILDAGRSALTNALDVRIAP